MAIREPRFKILSCFFCPKSRRLRSRELTSVTPAYDLYATPLSSACKPLVSCARSRRAPRIFSPRSPWPRRPSGSVETTLREKDKYLLVFKPSVLTLPSSRRNLPIMAAMTFAAAMPATRAQFAPRRTSKARVVRRGVVASAGKRGTSLTSERTGILFFLRVLERETRPTPETPPSRRSQIRRVTVARR